MSFSPGSYGHPGAGGPSGLRPTAPALVIVLAVLGGCLGWVVAVLISSTSSSTPGMTWPVAGVWVVLAAVLLGTAWRTYDRLHRKNLYLESAAAVRLLVFGKAAAIVAPVVGGFYLGIAVWRLAIGPGRLSQPDMQALLLGVLALFGAAVGGLLLQAACRIPRDGDDDNRPQPA